MKSIRPIHASTIADDEAPDARFDALLTKYGVLLRRAIQRVCPRALGLSCDDLEQEARISLWKALKGESEIAAPVSYIYKVAVSVTLRAIRRTKARREEALDEGGDGTVQPLYAPTAASPYTAAERQEYRQKIADALTRLQENRRLAVQLHLQGLTTREIGDILGWTEPKARNLVHRGLRDLRAALRTMGIECGG